MSLVQLQDSPPFPPQKGALDLVVCPFIGFFIRFFVRFSIISFCSIFSCINILFALIFFWSFFEEIKNDLKLKDRSFVLLIWFFFAIVEIVFVPSSPLSFVSRTHL